MAHPTTPSPGNGAPAASVDALPLWQDFAPDLALQNVLWSEVIPGGAHSSWLVSRGTSLRFAALEDEANCSVVLYGLPPAVERYNMPDSLKAQHTAHYTRGHVLMSDMGRAMASITSDTLGWHDPFGSLLDTPTMEERYGVQRYQTHRNAMHRSGRDGLLIEIGKYGYLARDLIAPVNLFSKVTVDEQGRFAFATGHSRKGASVELRLDMDVLVAVSAAPHALDPGNTYRPGRVGVAAWRSGCAAADDFCRNFCPENARAHHNADLFAAR